MVSASPEYIAWLVFGMWGQQQDIVTLLPLNQMAIVSFISGTSQKLGHLEHMTNKRVTLQKLLFTYYTCTYINYNQAKPLPYKGKSKNNLGWDVGKNRSCSKTQKEEHYTLRPLYLTSSLIFMIIICIISFLRKRNETTYMNELSYADAVCCRQCTVINVNMVN